MKELYLQLKCQTGEFDNTDKFLCLTNILRSLLQVISISTLELTKSETSIDELDISGLVDRFKRPTDGMPVDIIDKLTPHLRSHFEPRIFTGWYEQDKSTGKSLSTMFESLWV